MLVGMYKEFHLHSALRPFVECAWVLRSNPDGVRETRRILPDGCTDLVVTLGQSVDVFGPKNSFHLVSNRQNFVGFRLRLGFAQAVMAVAPEEITGRSAPLEAIWGSSACGLEQHLLAAERPEAAIPILEKALLRRAANAPEPDRVVLTAVDRLRRFPNTRVNQLAAVLELSERQFRRRFQHHVGLSVKQLARVTRFQRLVDDLRAHWQHSTGSWVGWAGLAHDHGYADQAHLVRECRNIAGVTPARLLMNF